MIRRHFLSRVLSAMAVAPVVAACKVGDDYDSPAPPGADAAPAATSFVVTNTDASGHSHSFTIQCAHDGADGWTYTAEGGHTHRVSLDRQQLNSVFAGETVTVETSGGHPHTWTIKRPDSGCA